MDLSEIDLDDKPPKDEFEIDTEFDLSEDEEEEEDDDSPGRKHTKSEDLHLYYRQRFFHRIGPWGVAIMGTYLLGILIGVSLFLYSLSTPGEKLFQNLTINILK